MYRPPGPFSAAASRDGATVVVALTGELDIASAPELERAVPPLAAGDTLVIDLRELAFLDSSGVHALMRLDVAAREHGWSLVVVRGGPDVQRILDVVRLGDRVRMVDAPREIAPELS
jgi:anti-sigma B factor antagonist